jgi:UDP-N-acetylmuramoyl-tripeptide--D-alanyl-D-alanine ligase
MKLTTSQILSALPSCNRSGNPAEQQYRAVATDTRSDCRGALFVALRGESFDANAFLEQAAAAGAVGALIEASAHDHAMPEGLQYFEVDDTLAALQQLAVSSRERIGDIRVVAVTGSNGKSTTKEMIASVVSSRWRTHATHGNFNNHIGVPLTLLAMPEDTEVLIAELGANHPGEIRELARMVKPEISVITNVAAAHLEGFGSVEGVLAAKTELFEETTPGGTCIYCGDNSLLSDDVPARFCNTVSFGLKTGSDIHASALKLSSEGAPSLTIGGGVRIALSTPGRHNALNALAATAVGRALGLDDETIRQGLEAVQPMKMRGQLKKIGSFTILDDSYNANPLSMAEALKTLMALEHKGLRVAVLGQMLELGETAPELHGQLATRAAQAGVDMAVMVGEHAEIMKEAWVDGGGEESRAFAAENADSAWAILQAQLQGGELLLVKGSRGIRLERVIEKLAAREEA